MDAMKNLEEVVMQEKNKSRTWSGRKLLLRERTKENKSRTHDD